MWKIPTCKFDLNFQQKLSDFFFFLKPRMRHLKSLDVFKQSTPRYLEKIQNSRRGRENIRSSIKNALLLIRLELSRYVHFQFKCRCVNFVYSRRQWLCGLEKMATESNFLLAVFVFFPFTSSSVYDLTTWCSQFFSLFYARVGMLSNEIIMGENNNVCVKREKKQAT